jgi:hypothetical protein
MPFQCGRRDPKDGAVSNSSTSRASRASELAGALSLALTLCAGAASAQLSSYPTSAIDVIGVTGAATVALGVPDYSFINDVGLGFGGTSTDVFDVGEAVEFTYSTPLRNDPAQHDVVLSAFVGGLGATDDATVQVAVSSDGSNFAIVQTFDTEEARDRPQDLWENDFEGVKHFFVEFGAEDNVTHIRLTNLAGTSEGLRLDSIEGLHPVVDSDHAFEVRLERVREETARRFKVRIKNIGDSNGVPIREWHMNRTASTARLEATTWMLESADGDFICVENCVPDNHPELIPYSRHVWSLDGATEAPAGSGLAPGRQAAHARYADFDTDGGVAYLSGVTFTVVFADGFAHTFDYDSDVLKEIGSLYQKYLYFSSAPIQSWNRPVDYYQFVSAGPVPVPSLSVPSFWLLTLLIAASGGFLIRSRRRARQVG